MSSAELSRLRWRCRRGTRELDGLMLSWLDAHYPLADDADRAAFSALLDLQDPDLMALIMTPDQQGRGDDGITTQDAVLRQIRRGIKT